MRGARPGLYGGWGKTWILLSFKMLSDHARFVATGVVVEKQDVLGVGD